MTTGNAKALARAVRMTQIESNKAQESLNINRHGLLAHMQSNLGQMEEYGVIILKCNSESSMAKFKYFNDTCHLCRIKIFKIRKATKYSWLPIIFS